MRRSLATPCPVGPTGYQCSDDTSTNFTTTTNFEYTTTFQASFREIKSRRRQRSRRGTVNFTIHEDEGTQLHDQSTVPRDEPGRLLKPARRGHARQLPPHVEKLRQTEGGNTANSSGLQLSLPVRPVTASRRLSIQSYTHMSEMAQEEKEPKQRLENPMSRPARRKTIYIPSDDTTQPTMWMGIFSPIKGDLSVAESIEPARDAAFAGLAAQMTCKKQRRSSTIQAQPRRLPLRLNAVDQQKAVKEVDREGAQTGKENVPPNSLNTKTDEEMIRTAAEPKRRSTTGNRDVERKAFLSKARLDQLSQPKASSSQELLHVLTMYEVGARRQPQSPDRAKKSVAWNAGPRAINHRSPPRRKPTKQANFGGPRDNQPEAPLRVPSRFVRPSLLLSVKPQEQVPTIEHIERPELYEDDWLARQEVVVTSLVNDLLGYSQASKSGRFDQERVKKDLFDFYNTSETSLLHKRLQVALLYGSLSLSHEAMIHVTTLCDDVGRKRGFLEFWLENYELSFLRVALEVVTGRQVSTSTIRKSAGPRSVMTSERRLLAQFIEAFILRHEDSEFKPAGTGMARDLGTKTILKSIMLLKILDTCKERIVGGSGPCLFYSNASFKCSEAALQNLMRLLNPSMGDAIRALRQHGYGVSHKQESLTEIEYQVTNLATDLRNGLVLTRLVEILLFAPVATGLYNLSDTDTNTIHVTAEDSLMLDSNDTYPLSRHVRIPCLSRPAKIWNVQLALAALSRVHSMSHIVVSITADCIVDGHREKTMTLLWTLICQYGLCGLLDMTDLKQEIRRLTGATWESNHELDMPQLDQSSQFQSQQLLKVWTTHVCAAHGLTIRNFTTSFSDGQPFEAILDEYEPYLATDHQKRTLTLPQRLQRLGCSEQFSQMFSLERGKPHILSKDFVIAALAFLCSRVVGPSKLCRKAIAIQRCWRKHREILQARQRAVTRDLAQAWAASVSLKWPPERDTDTDATHQLSRIKEETENEDNTWLAL